MASNGVNCLYSLDSFLYILYYQCILFITEQSVWLIVIRNR